MTAGDELDTLRTLMGPAHGPAGPVTALPWAPAGAGPAVLARQVARRTSAATGARLRAVAARRGLQVVRPVRGSLRPGLRDRLRRRAGSGYVAFPLMRGRPTLLDLVLRDIGAELVSAVALGADGAVRARVRRDGIDGMLRLGLTGSPADPSHAVEGLRRLAEQGSPLVPRVLAAGDADTISWVLEQLQPGRRPGTLSAALLDQVATFTAALPTASGPTTLPADADVVAGVAPPAGAPRVQRAAELVASSPPATGPQLRHGDLWSGNLLVSGNTLTGVVDWDAWAPAGVPGVDLLHLIGTDLRIRTRSSLGEVWLRRPWDEPPVVELLRRHWPDWGGDARARAAVGLAWWLGQLAADLRRNPALGDDAAWVARNVTVVADTLG